MIRLITICSFAIQFKPQEHPYIMYVVCCVRTSLLTLASVFHADALKFQVTLKPIHFSGMVANLKTLCQPATEWFNRNRMLWHLFRQATALLSVLTVVTWPLALPDRGFVYVVQRRPLKYRLQALRPKCIASQLWRCKERCTMCNSSCAVDHFCSVLQKVVRDKVHFMPITSFQRIWYKTFDSSLQLFFGKFLLQ